VQETWRVTDSEKTWLAVFGKRAAARFIDCCFAGFALVVCWGFGFILVAGDCGDGDSCSGPSGIVLVFILIFSGSAFVAGAIAPILHDFIGSTYWGTTIGKSALGLRVTHVDGSRAGWWQCLLRAIAFWLSLGIPVVVIFGVLGTPAIAPDVGRVSWESLTLILSFTSIAGATAIWLFRRKSFHGVKVIYVEP
jgi:uncharacterized RDD family membrane protein YckC